MSTLGKAYIEVPEGWKRKPLEVMSRHWRTVVTPDGKNLWLNFDDGHTQHKAPVVTEAPEDLDGQPCAIEEYWGEVTEPGNDVVRHEALTVALPALQPNGFKAMSQ